MFSALDLTQLQAVVTAALPESAVVQRRTATSDGRGGQTESWATVMTAPARIARLTARDQLVADKLGVAAEATLVLPAGADVRFADRVLAGGASWTVLAVLAPTSYETRRTALLGRLL